MLGPALENNLSVLIKKRRYSAALHNVAVIHSACRGQARSVKEKSGSGIFSLRSRWCYCAKIIAGVAVAFPLVVSSVHLPAVRGPGRDRLRQLRHLGAAAAAAGAVVTEAADH